MAGPGRLKSGGRGVRGFGDLPKVYNPLVPRTALEPSTRFPKGSFNIRRWRRLTASDSPILRGVFKTTVSTESLNQEPSVRENLVRTCRRINTNIKTIPVDLDWSRYFESSMDDDLGSLQLIINRGTGQIICTKGFGFIIIKNGQGKIPEGGLLFCTRLMIHDPVTKINVDSHLIITPYDMFQFNNDFTRLVSELIKLGIDIRRTKISVAYGNRRIAQGIFIPGRLIIEHLESLGLKIDGVYPAESIRDVYLFDLETGEVTLSEEKLF